jgi:hypothetical protein
MPRPGGFNGTTPKKLRLRINPTLLTQVRLPRPSIALHSESRIILLRRTCRK